MMRGKISVNSMLVIIIHSLPVEVKVLQIQFYSTSLLAKSLGFIVGMDCRGVETVTLMPNARHILRLKPIKERLRETNRIEIA